MINSKRNKILNYLKRILEKYSFLENKIRDVNIFRVMLNDHIHSTVTFVSSDFKAKVEENNLVGLKFEKVWESNS